MKRQSVSNSSRDKHSNVTSHPHLVYNRLALPAEWDINRAEKLEDSCGVKGERPKRSTLLNKAQQFWPKLNILQRNSTKQLVSVSNGRRSTGQLTSWHHQHLPVPDVVVVQSAASGSWRRWSWSTAKWWIFTNTKTSRRTCSPSWTWYVTEGCLPWINIVPWCTCTLYMYVFLLCF